MQEKEQKKSKIKGFFQDFMLILGYSAVVFGIYEIYQPASFVIGGLMVLFAFFPKPKKGAD